MDLARLNDLPPWEWPESAEDLLLANLRGVAASEAERELAAELAGNTVVMNEEIAAALLAIVGSSSEPEALRCTAAISLGPILEEIDLDPDDPELPISAALVAEIRATFRSLFRDAATPLDVRRRVLEASVRAPEEWHADAIRAAYYGDAAKWKLTAVFGMAWVSGFDAEIAEACGSPDPKLRYEALRAAANWGVAAAWPHILSIMRNEREDMPTRLRAIDAAVYVEPDEAGIVLSELADHEDKEIAGAALDALAELEAAIGEDDLDDTDEWF